ncbi:MAG: LPS-assembly protein LptD [Sideroxydans sp.]
MLFRSRLIACSLLFVLPCLVDAETLPLKLDHTFKVLPPPSDTGVAYLSAQRMETRQGKQIEASGEVELRQDGRVVNADHLTYEQDRQQVSADGNVRLEQAGTQVSGPTLQLNLAQHTGVMEQAQFVLGKQAARGHADRVEMEGNNRYTFRSAAYTTCPAGNDDWLLNVSRLELDRNTQVGVAHHAWVEFKGVPLLYTPWMDFALNDDKRSGFLGPVFGSTNSGGSEITVPYFWNIASNLDVTFSPRVISKRGIQFNNELRYLEPAYAGEVKADVLAQDRVAGRDRVHAALRHSQNLGHGFSAAANLNAVSDDAYYRDLANDVNGSAQVNLLREGVLNYAGGWWNASARVQRYQTLQDPLAPVAVPYRRQPQLSLNAQQTLSGANVALSGEYVDYRHPTSVNGQRLVLYPSVSYPLLNGSGYFMTPKLGVHYTDYVLGDNNASGLPNSSRTVPIFSLDSGLIFERDESFLGAGFVQTLEPRVYYVRIPYRDQGRLPNFDSAEAPFSFSQMFSENRFLGSDRVGDADMVTVAITSRVIADEDGTERLRVAVAERFQLDTPRVNLVTPGSDNNRSDILATLGGRVNAAWRVDGQLQYNPNQAYTQNYNLAARYHPEAGKAFNLGYRFTRDTLRQADVSAQWPLFGRWYGVGRFNYSLRDERILEALGGLEYNAACWAVRLVAQSFATATAERTTGVFVQLELNDLVRIGSDPLDALRGSVPGYSKLNAIPVAEPVEGLR